MPKSFEKKKNSALKYFILLPILLLLVVFVGVMRKIEYFTSDPTREKDCPPIFPGNSINNTLTINKSQINNLIPLSQRGGTINDASCLNRTNIYGLVRVYSVEDIKRAILFAQDNKLKVSIAGVKHSMGGQAFAKDALVLDMTGFNKMSLDKENKTLKVESGASWHDIQNYLNQENLAIKSMQSIDIFTVGGTVSVNGHGTNHKVGSIASTIKSMTLMIPNGKIVTICGTHIPELF